MDVVLKEMTFFAKEHLIEIERQSLSHNRLGSLMGGGLWADIPYQMGLRQSYIKSQCAERCHRSGVAPDGFRGLLPMGYHCSKFQHVTHLHDGRHPYPVDCSHNVAFPGERRHQGSASSIDRTHAIRMVFVRIQSQLSALLVHISPAGHHDCRTVHGFAQL